MDTSVIISSLMRDSMSRRLILHPDLVLFTPEYVNIEINNHFNKILSYSGIPRNEFDILLNQILNVVNIVPVEEFEDFLEESYEIMRENDPEDTAFLALALSLQCDGIWTNDNDFQKQNRVNVWKTHILKRII